MIERIEVVEAVPNTPTGNRPDLCRTFVAAGLEFTPKTGGEAGVRSKRKSEP